MPKKATEKKKVGRPKKVVVEKLKEEDKPDTNHRCLKCGVIVSDDRVFCSLGCSNV